MSDAPRFLFSTSPDSYRDAVAELKALYPTARAVRIGDDVGQLTCEALTLERLAQACLAGPAVFVRHLTEVCGTIPLEDVETGLPLLGSAAQALVETWPGAAPIALQVWSAQGAPGRLQARVEAALRERLSATGREVKRAGRAKTLHVCIARRGLILAQASTADALADWPGGRVRLRAAPDQASRSGLKLEEAISVFGLDLPGGVAVDLGASPGGWSQVLAQRGFTVHAVDPADLAPAVLAQPKLEHHKMTAGRFLAQARVRADLVVNDMRMDPLMSCEVMLQAVGVLKPGGLAVVTLKLPENHPAPVAVQALGRLKRAYQILGARQLYHNRREATVALRLK